MSETERHNPSDVSRMVVLAIAAVMVNILRALVIDRDAGLGLDDLRYVVGGLALAAAVEFGYFRRRGHPDDDHLR